jgi:hypothetical protein
VPSIRNDIAWALEAGRIPAFAGGMRGVGLKLGLTSPMSLRAMDNLLNPASHVFSSGERVAGNVHGWADLGIQSDGLLSFRGHVHEAGVVGDNYFFGAALLDVKDSAGNTMVVTQFGYVEGSSTPGWSGDDAFQNDAANQLLKDQWDTAKNSRVQFTLHVSSNPFAVTLTVIEGLLVLVGVVVTGYGGSRCDWSYGKTDPNTGEQRGLYCEPSQP